MPMLICFLKTTLVPSIAALSLGCALRAEATALKMNGM